MYGFIWRHLPGPAWLKAIEDDGTWKRIWEATIGKSLGGTAPHPPALGSVPGSSAGGDATPQSS